MNKRGFTLIELLAVVVILAVIAMISVPLIFNLIKEVKEGAFEDTAYGLLKVARMESDIEKLNGTPSDLSFSFPGGEDVSGAKLDFKGTMPLGGTININTDGTSEMAIFDGVNCAIKLIGSTEITVEAKLLEECIIPISIEGLYSGAILTDMIENQDYKPISTANELALIKTAGSNTFGLGTVFESTYTTTGITDKYILVSDIDLDVSPYNSGLGWDPIANFNDGDDPFNGTFDGNGFTISNLMINRPTESYVGLFGYGRTNVIKNVKFLNINVIGNNYIGGIIGYNEGTVANSSAEGTVVGSSGLGGITGHNGAAEALISNSYFIGTVTGSAYSTGIAGINVGTIDKVYASVILPSGTTRGGISGFNTLTISSSYWNTTNYPTSIGGTGVVDALMKQELTFATWDFNNVWKIDETNDYPRLIWE